MEELKWPPLFFKIIFLDKIKNKLDKDQMMES